MRKIKIFITLLLATLFGCMMFSACELNLGKTQQKEEPLTAEQIVGTYVFEGSYKLVDDEVKKQTDGDAIESLKETRFQANEDYTATLTSMGETISGTWKISHNQILFEASSAEIQSGGIIFAYANSSLFSLMGERYIAFKKENSVSTDASSTIENIVGTYQYVTTIDVNDGKFVEIQEQNVGAITLNADGTGFIKDYNSEEGEAITWKLSNNNLLIIKTTESSNLGAFISYNNSTIALIYSSEASIFKK